jgi:hypothetical protein
MITVVTLADERKTLWALKSIMATGTIVVYVCVQRVCFHGTARTVQQLIATYRPTVKVVHHTKRALVVYSYSDNACLACVCVMSER